MGNVGETQIWEERRRKNWADVWQSENILSLWLGLLPRAGNHLPLALPSLRLLAAYVLTVNCCCCWTHISFPFSLSNIAPDPMILSSSDLGHVEMTLNSETYNQPSCLPCTNLLRLIITCHSCFSCCVARTVTKPKSASIDNEYLFHKLPMFRDFHCDFDSVGFLFRNLLIGAINQEHLLSSKQRRLCYCYLYTRI